MLGIAKIKDPGYYLRAVADVATAKELGVTRSLDPNILVAYRLADGTTVLIDDVKRIRREVSVAGLRLADGTEVALDGAIAIRSEGRITGYQVGGKEVSAKDVHRCKITRRRTVGYRLADGREVAKDDVHTVTAAEVGAGFVGPDGRVITASSVAIQEVDGRILGYYSEHGEAPGRWIGRGAVEDLGLTGRVSLTENRERYEALMAGRDPDTGAQLTKGQPGGARVAGYDLLFTCPKSVSILWALTDDRAFADQLETAHKDAVDVALAWLEEQVSFVRRGHASGGHDDPNPDTIRYERTAGLVAAAFFHRATRPVDGAEDPHMHTHVVVANLMRCLSDGHWNALDATEIYRLLQTAGYLYEAQHRANLAALGLQMTQPVNGLSEIKGLDDRKLIEAFSQRSAEVEGGVRDALAEVNADRIARGLDPLNEASAEARDLASHRTRSGKESPKSTAELRAIWLQTAAAIGLGQERIGKVLNQGVAKIAEINSALARRMARALTENVNVFEFTDALKAVAGYFPQGVPVDRSVELARALLGGELTDEIVGLGDTGEVTAKDVIRRKDGRVVAARGAWRGEHAERYTTKEIISLELRIRDNATRRLDAAVALARPEAVTKALLSNPGLFKTKDGTSKDPTEQSLMVEGITKDGAGVVCVFGGAGKGKTFALKAAADAFRDSRIPVIATAAVKRRARALGADLGIPESAWLTIAALRQRVEGTAQHAGTRLPKGCVVICDEASVVNARDLDALARHVEAVKGKLVLVGDPAQLDPIGPMAPLNELARLVPTYTLTQNQRFTDPDEALALDQLHNGDTKAYLDWATSAGRIVYVTGSLREAKASLIDWIKGQYVAAHARGESVAALAATHKDRKALNTAIRAALVESGAIQSDEIEVGGLKLAVGDILQPRKNHPRLGVSTGELLVVTKIHVEAEDNPVLQSLPLRLNRNKIGQSVVQVRRPDGELLYLSRYYAENHLDYGFAMTVHSRQGDSVDRAWTLADANSLSSQWGYTALTRASEENILCFAGERPADVEHHLPEENTPSVPTQRTLLEAGLRLDRSKQLATEPEPTTVTETATQIPEVKRWLAAMDVAPEAEAARPVRDMPLAREVPQESPRATRIRAAIEITNAIDRGDLQSVARAIVAGQEATLTRAGVPLDPSATVEPPKVPVKESALETVHPLDRVAGVQGEVVPEPTPAALAQVASRTLDNDQRKAQRRSPGRKHEEEQEEEARRQQQPGQEPQL
ncbi:MAG: MobF family relaxase [Candidatus Dormibacteria bacterium]